MPLKIIELVSVEASYRLSETYRTERQAYRKATYRTDRKTYGIDRQRKTHRQTDIYTDVFPKKNPFTKVKMKTQEHIFITAEILILIY